MYLDEIPENILPGQHVRIKYDCNGGFKLCGTIANPIYKSAKKNADTHNGQHICRSCQMSQNNPGTRTEVKEKIKKTNLEKYGGILPVNSPEKIAERVEKMFGTQEAIDARNEKTKETNRKKFGADHIMKTEEGIKRLNEAMQEKYGVDYPLQSAEIQEKMRQTCLERFGVDNPLSDPEIRAKCAQTSLELYGVEHYNQLPEMKEYLRQNCTIWLAESYKNPWARGIIRPQEWNNKQRETVRLRIQSGDWPGGFTSNFKGRFPALKCKKIMPRFLSMLEAKFHLFLNANPNVDWYDYEGLVIEYKKSDGTPHDYYVDFQVKYLDDPIIHNYELKAWKNKDKFDTQLKYDAATEYCTKNDMMYNLLFEEDVDKLGISDDLVKNLPGLDLYKKVD